jgi:hypothetical protein
MNGARGIPSGSPTARNHVVTGGFDVIDTDLQQTINIETKTCNNSFR